MNEMYEPTLYDVIELIQKMDDRNQMRFETLSSRMDNFGEQMVNQRRITTKLAIRIEEIYDELVDFKNFVSDMLKNHEKRITKLEVRPT